MSVGTVAIRSFSSVLSLRKTPCRVRTDKKSRTVFGPFPVSAGNFVARQERTTRRGRLLSPLENHLFIGYYWQRVVYSWAKEKPN